MNAVVRPHPDIDGDGAVDRCVTVTRPGFTGLSCTLARGGRTVSTGNIDLGYPEGRAWVDFDGDGKDDYCRLIGTGYPNSKAACLLSEGDRFGNDLISADHLDWGYPESRQWRDANGDGKADFCRVIGNNRELMACTFSLGRVQPYFGRTVTTRR
jgi:hypothetical protein